MYKLQLFLRRTTLLSCPGGETIEEIMVVQASGVACKDWGHYFLLATGFSKYILVKHPRIVLDRGFKKLKVKRDRKFIRGLDNPR